MTTSIYFLKIEEMSCFVPTKRAQEKKKQISGITNCLLCFFFHEEKTFYLTKSKTTKNVNYYL